MSRIQTETEGYARELLFETVTQHLVSLATKRTHQQQAPKHNRNPFEENINQKPQRFQEQEVSHRRLRNCEMEHDYYHPHAQWPMRLRSPRLQFHATTEFGLLQRHDIWVLVE
jgi:hypothetical protein